MTPRRHPHARRGTTLIEAVIVVIILAVSVPPTVSWLLRAADRRSDAILVTRATTLASTVLDQIMSDSTASDIGSSATYVDGSGGLRSRLATLTQADTAGGLTYTVQFGAASNQNLVVSPTSTTNLYRTVTVTVAFTDSAGVSRSVPISTVISKP